jgi:hypothetical protein
MLGHVHSLRSRVRRAYALYRGILILTNGLVPSLRSHIDRSLISIDTLPRRHLAVNSKKIQAEVTRVTRHYGFKGTAADIDRLLESAERQPADTYLYITKAHLLDLFARYERALPIFPRLPLHARISVDVKGSNTVPNRVEVFQLEGALFEDFAALWNVALDIEPSLNDERSTPSRIVQTRYGAITRAFAKAAFNLIEGVLNCIAFDILVSRDLEPSQEDTLREWDRQKERPRLLSLRDKILQYPRIAVSGPHPPLQESNCAEMKLILELEPAIRHALIHPTPITRDPDYSHPRESAFILSPKEDLERLCDATVGLIARIYDTVGPSFGDPALWLYRRGADGRFPTECFR